MRFKPFRALRFLGGLILAAVLAVVGFVWWAGSTSPRHPAVSPAEAAVASAQSSPRAAPPEPAPLPPAPSTPAPTSCGVGPEDAAQANADSLRTLAWSPFGKTETGWATYAPLIGREIGSGCGPETPGFALALLQWAGAHHLPTADGRLDPTLFAALKTAIQLRRPFVRLSARGVCPAPPGAGDLAWATADEGYGGKRVQLRPAALAASRAMAAAARREDPAVAADGRNLTLFSGFRDPAADAARCEREHNCNGVQRATCSAHRTGLAMDVYVGQAPGFPPDSSADANRAFMSATPAYRWLVANAGRFGFVPYPFEPWHWEWTGEAP